MEEVREIRKNLQSDLEIIDADEEKKEQETAEKTKRTPEQVEKRRLLAQKLHATQSP